MSKLPAPLKAEVSLASSSAGAFMAGLVLTVNLTVAALLALSVKALILAGFGKVKKCLVDSVVTLSLPEV
jgi:hypothetical protein